MKIQNRQDKYLERQRIASKSNNKDNEYSSGIEVVRSTKNIQMPNKANYRIPATWKNPNIIMNK